MKNEQAIEERLEQIANFIENASSFVENLDIALPEQAKNAITNIIESEDIKEIVSDIKTRRPPKIVIMGRSGVGKSSLINAMFGTYLAETSPVDVGTEEHEFFQYKKNGRVIFEMIDTRGIKENINELGHSAEDSLHKVIEEFNPDAFLFLTNGADRSTLHEDAKDLKKIFTKMNINPPLITVITRVDDLEPSRIKIADEYTSRKVKNIDDKKKQVKQVLRDVGLYDSFVIPVSAYMEWSHEDPESLSIEERELLSIEYDGRYNIEELLNTIENNVDFNVALDMMLHHEIEKSIEKIANQFVKKFSNASFLVGITPIPGMDILILLPIQITEVVIITYLTGNQIDAKTAREFILSLGAVFLFGFGLRFVAQQGTKLLNVVPGAGSAISGTIAYSGTYSIGKAAIAYYVNGKSLSEAKKEAEKAKSELDTESEIILDTGNQSIHQLSDANNRDDVTSHEEDHLTEDIFEDNTSSDNHSESTMDKLKGSVKRKIGQSKEALDKMRANWSKKK